MNSVVFVVGPTASGKSELALRLAQHFSGGILNCDSLQIYRRLDVGTAKPSVAERRLVPHYLFDEVEAGQILTAGDFRRMAMQQLERHAPQRLVFAVGGSGFYIQALEKGLFELEKSSAVVTKQVKDELAARGLARLYQELERSDPEYAEQISPNDAYRVARAVTVIRDSGRRMSDLKKQFKPQEFPFPKVKLGLTLERAELLPRVEARVQRMLAAGLLAEVERLLAEGFERWPALQSVGYRECVAHLRGQVSFDQLAPLIVEKTMQLAKKQRTWFRRDREIHWLSTENALAEATLYVKTNARYS